MKVVCYPSDVLRQKADNVTEFDEALRQTARDMIETMYAANGVGLAAQQVGLTIRMAVLNCDGKPGDELVLVNPEIIDSSGKLTSEEGCLSFPGIFSKIQRAAQVKVRYQDLDGNEQTLEAGGLPARAVQHELDHLDGVLICDRMSRVQRMANRRALKMLEARQRGDSNPFVG
jgi:peptide deformylase